MENAVRRHNADILEFPEDDHVTVLFLGHILRDSRNILTFGAKYKSRAPHGAGMVLSADNRSS